MRMVKYPDSITRKAQMKELDRYSVGNESLGLCNDEGVILSNGVLKRKDIGFEKK